MTGIMTGGSILRKSAVGHVAANIALQHNHNMDMSTTEIAAIQLTTVEVVFDNTCLVDLCAPMIGCV
jgi:hypothetical protein